MENGNSIKFIKARTTSKKQDKFPQIISKKYDQPALKFHLRTLLIFLTDILLKIDFYPWLYFIICQPEQNILTSNFQKGKMPELISLPFFQQQFTQFDPIQFAHTIGDICRVCKLKITYPQSISVCGCHRYIHEKCLLKEINQENKKKDQLAFKCKTCHKALTVFYSLQVKRNLHANKLNILLIIFSLLWLPFAIYSAYRFKDDYLKQLVNSLIIAILLGTLSVSVINSCIIKQYTAIGVKATNLGVIISAFAQIEKDLQDQITQTQMVR